MTTKIKFISAILSAGLLITPVTMIGKYNNIAKAEEINLTNINNNTVISKEMTKKELIEYYAKNHNVSYQEAKAKLFKSDIDYRMILYKYRTIRKYLPFDTRIEFYTKGDGWNNYYAIEKILNISVKNPHKSFQGSVYANLESNTIIYYDIEGDLYDSGTTTVSGGVSLGIGEAGSVNLGASHSSNIHGHISESGRVSV